MYKYNQYLCNLYSLLQLEALYPDVYKNVHEYGQRYCKGVCDFYLFILNVKSTIRSSDHKETMFIKIFVFIKF